MVNKGDVDLRCLHIVSLCFAVTDGLIFLVATALSPLCRAHTILEEFYCKDSDVEYGRSLNGGNAAGMFDNYGKTKNIQVSWSQFFKLINHLNASIV